MSKEFVENEKLYRAVRKKPSFIKSDGTITSAAFKHTGKGSNGLSVDRQMGRTNDDSIEFMKRNLEGVITSVRVKECIDNEIFMQYSPSKNNSFHTELYANNELEKLTSNQIMKLVENCIVESD